MIISNETTTITRIYEFRDEKDRADGVEILKLNGFYPIGLPIMEMDRKVIRQEFFKKEIIY